MFTFFKSAPKPPPYRYLAYLSKVGKYKQMILEMSQSVNQPALFIYFFESTRDEVSLLCEALGQKVSEYRDKTNEDEIVLCSGFSLDKVHARGFKRISFIELHPLASISQKAAHHVASLDLKVVFNIGLDEPLMSLFGSERIQNMMRTLGTSEDEVIEHALICKSIENAQQKIEKDLPFPKDIRTSPEDWAKVNKID
jgi:hypothetical protein